jgi:hypothetical protein
MLIPTALIAFLWLGWFAVWATRKLNRKRLKWKKRRQTQELVRKADHIFALTELTGKTMVIHRGLPGYWVMAVQSDFQARLGERGKSAIGKPDFERIERTLEWWLRRETYMMAFSGSALLSFHRGHMDSTEDDRDFMPVTYNVKQVTTTLQALDAYYTYLGLPSSLDEARKRKSEVVRAAEPTPLPPRESREYEITPANKIDHIVEYVEDGDPRTFSDMFYGDFDDEFVMWVDHRESDDDIVKMCERVLKTNALDAWFDDETLDLIVEYRGIRHRIEYPNDFADRDTSIIALHKIVQPEFELRYCTASDGSDGAAILPLRADEWQKLEARCGEKLHRFFEPIDDSFSKFG